MPARPCIQCPLYLELEERLEQMTGRPVMVAASTSLGHMSALPILVRDTGVMIIDSLHSWDFQLLYQHCTLWRVLIIVAMVQRSVC